MKAAIERGIHFKNADMLRPGQVLETGTTVQRANAERADSEGACVIRSAGLACSMVRACCATTMR